VQILAGIALGFAAVGLLFLALAAGAFKKRRWVGAIGRTGASTITARLMGSLVLSLVQASPVPVTVVP